MAFHTPDPKLQAIEERNRQLRARTFARLFRRLGRRLTGLLGRRRRGAGSR